MKKLILFLTATLIATTTGFAQQAAIIANPANDTSSLSASELEAILQGSKKQWTTGGNIEIAILKSGPAHDEVLRTYAKKSPAQFKTFWRSLVFSGRGVMPQEFDDAAAMISYVAKTPNAIGYVDAAEVDGSVKVISVSQ